MLAIAICALGARPGSVRADEGEDEIPPGARVTKIGPQAVVIEQPNGRITMYDDPAQQAGACNSRASCATQALGILAVFGVLTYEDLTEGVEGGGRIAGRPE